MVQRCRGFRGEVFGFGTLAEHDLAKTCALAEPAGFCMTSVVRKNQRGQRIGQDHPKARYADREVELVRQLRDGGWGYKRIARTMEMPRSTVRDICSGRCR